LRVLQGPGNYRSKEREKEEVRKKRAVSFTARKFLGRKKILASKRIDRPKLD
jgi:hypothetical protein